MPQALPAKPHLEWLRKAAKLRLAELRAEKPEARLHQAQLAVANDYGFKSWRALKIHVDRTIPMRTAANVLGIGRVAEAVQVRGIYP